MDRRRTGIVRAAIFVLGLTLTALPAVGDEVDDFVRAAMEKQKIPGLSLAVVRDGEPVRVQGYGEDEIEIRLPHLPPPKKPFASNERPI